MPIITGYDETETTSGTGDWPTGEYPVEITGAKLADGNGAKGAWTALDVSVEGGGRSRNIRVFYPNSNDEWQNLTDGQRKSTKSQLEGIGIHMSELENETARAALIGAQRKVKVAKNGDYTNYYFQKSGGMDVAALPEPESVVTGETRHLASVGNTASNNIVV